MMSGSHWAFRIQKYFYLVFVPPATGYLLGSKAAHRTCIFLEIISWEIKDKCILGNYINDKENIVNVLGCVKSF